MGGGGSTVEAEGVTEREREREIRRREGEKEREGGRENSKHISKLVGLPVYLVQPIRCI